MSGYTPSKAREYPAEKKLLLRHIHFKRVRPDRRETCQQQQNDTHFTWVATDQETERLAGDLVHTKRYDSGHPSFFSAAV